MDFFGVLLTSSPVVGRRGESFCFDAIVSSCANITVLFDAAGWPSDDDAVNGFRPSEAKGEWQLALRQITAAALDCSRRFMAAGVLGSDHRTYGVAVRFRADQTQPDAAVSVADVVAVQIRRARRSSL